MTPRSLQFICASTVILLSAALPSGAQTTSASAASFASVTSSAKPSAQTASWPKTINTAAGTIIHLYSPQILSWSGDSVQSRSVISVQGSPDREPVFGVAWTNARVVGDADKKLLTFGVVRLD